MRPFVLAALSAVAALLAIAACGSPTTTIIKTQPAASPAPSPAPDPAASVLYSALSAADSNVSSDPDSLASYANGVCNSIGKIALASQQAGQDAYWLGLRRLPDEFQTRLVAGSCRPRLLAHHPDRVLDVDVLFFLVSLLADQRCQGLSQALDGQAPLALEVAVLRLGKIVDRLGEVGMRLRVRRFQLQQQEPTVTRLFQRADPVALAELVADLRLANREVLAALYGLAPRTSTSTRPPSHSGQPAADSCLLEISNVNMKRATPTPRHT